MVQTAQQHAGPVECESQCLPESVLFWHQKRFSFVQGAKLGSAPMCHGTANQALVDMVSWPPPTCQSVPADTEVRHSCQIGEFTGQGPGQANAPQLQRTDAPGAPYLNTEAPGGLSMNFQVSPCFANFALVPGPREASGVSKLQQGLQFPPLVLFVRLVSVVLDGPVGCNFRFRPWIPAVWCVGL